MFSAQAALTAIALCLFAAASPAQSARDLQRQVDRGVADLTRSRVKQLGSGEWLRERFEIESISQRLDGPRSAVVQARIGVRRSFKLPEAQVPKAQARAENLPLNALGMRFDIELTFEPDAAWGQWIFAGGRYWILDEQGQRRVELAMFPDLLLDAPVDPPHELAWAIMSP